MVPSSRAWRLLLAISAFGAALAPAAASNLKTLYQFTGGPDGANPGGPLLLDGHGRLLGTATGGGRGNGVVFALAPAASPPWALTVLYSFAKSPNTGQVNPGLAVDGAGALYGSTYAFNAGFAFRLTPPSASTAPWRFTDLTNFPGINSPLGGGTSGVLAVGPAGGVTGVTQYGGDQSGQYPCQCGVIYRLPASTAKRTEQVLYTFTPLPDGNIPVAGLAPAAPGLFYGTTYLGGTGKCLDGSDVVVVGCGTVFQLARSDNKWTETTLYSFKRNEGNEPTDPVVIGPDGALYGYANLDVFQLTRRKNGTWRKQTIYTFPGGITGTAPTGTPLFDTAGSLVGTTRSFGIEGPSTVFRLTPPLISGQAWTATTLAAIGGYNDPQPVGGLTTGPHGSFYGAASSNIGGAGYIFAVSP